MTTGRVCWLFVAALNLVPTLALGELENPRIEPAVPTAGSNVYFVFDAVYPDFVLETGPEFLSVTTVGNDVTVSVSISTALVPPPPPGPLTGVPVAIALGTFPPGEYVLDYEVRAPFSGNRLTGTLGFTVTSRIVPATGVWAELLMMLGMLALAWFQFGRAGA